VPARAGLVAPSLGGPVQMLGDLVAGGAYTATITFPARPVPGQERAHRIARSVLVPAGDRAGGAGGRADPGRLPPRSASSFPRPAASAFHADRTRRPPAGRGDGRPAPGPQRARRMPLLSVRDLHWRRRPPGLRHASQHHDHGAACARPIALATVAGGTSVAAQRR
jgi:hypothetical protein